MIWGCGRQTAEMALPPHPTPHRISCSRDEPALIRWTFMGLEVRHGKVRDSKAWGPNGESQGRDGRRPLEAETTHQSMVCRKITGTLVCKHGHWMLPTPWMRLEGDRASDETQASMDTLISASWDPESIIQLHCAPTCDPWKLWEGKWVLF